MIRNKRNLLSWPCKWTKAILELPLGLTTCAGIVCYNCNGQGHMARSCPIRKHEVHMHCYRCNKIEHIAQDYLGNEAKDKMVSISSPNNIWDITDHPNPCRWDTVLSTYWFWLLLYHSQCQTLLHLEEKKLQSNHHKWWNVHKSQDRDSKNLLRHRNSDVQMLVMHEKPLNFDLLLSYDAIKALSSVLITQTQTVKFQGSPHVCSP